MCEGCVKEVFGVSTQYQRWRILCDMKIATGKVIGGKVVVEGVEFEEVPRLPCWPETTKAA
jgi:hypothetical protein